MFCGPSDLDSKEVYYSEGECEIYTLYPLLVPSHIFLAFYVQVSTRGFLSALMAGALSHRDSTRHLRKAWRLPQRRLSSSDCHLLRCLFVALHEDLQDDLQEL